MRRRSSGERGGGCRGRAARGAGVGIGLVCLASALGCANLKQTNRDTHVGARTEKKPIGGWEYTGQVSVDMDSGRWPAEVHVHADKDRPCLTTTISVVDRTVVNERTMPNARASRQMAYTIGGFGAAGAVTNLVVGAQMKDAADSEVFSVLAGVGMFLSISLITMIVRELSAIDTETHVGHVELPLTVRGRCDRQAPAGARVRLLRSRSEVVAEGVLPARGPLKLVLTGEPPTADAIHAVEVDGVIVTHVEIPAPKRAAQVAE
jgi:hypothetical protein